MKKIVGILAAAAVMASAAFAVDVSSMLQLDGDLFNYSKDGGVKALMLKQWDPQGSSDYVWKLSVSGDNAGAEIWDWADQNGNAVYSWDSEYKSGDAVQQYSIWFKPVDSLKITLGNVFTYSCWNPQFGWWAKNLAFEKYGVKAEYTYDALTVEASIGSGKGNYFFTAKNEGYDKISDFIVSAKYGLSAGTAQVWVAKGAAVHPHGFTGWNASDLAFGAVWGNCPYMQNGYFIDVAGTFDYKPFINESWGTADGFKFEKVLAQAYGQYFTNGFGAQLIVVGGYYAEHWGWDGTGCGKTEAAPLYGFEAKFQYAIDKYTPYLQIGGYDIASKKLTIDAGVTTSVGACSITAYADFPLDFNEGASFSFSVPVEFTVNL